MQGGDISNERPRTTYMVFEDLLATIAPESRGAYKRAVKRKNWTVAASLWDINAPMVMAVWNMRGRVAVITFLPQEESDALRIRFDTGRWPFADWERADYTEFLGECAWRPDIAEIIDGRPEHAWSYGSRGRHVSPLSPANLRSGI